MNGPIIVTPRADRFDPSRPGSEDPTLKSLRKLMLK